MAGTRVTLTKKQLDCDHAQRLLKLLKNITKDGELSDTELVELRTWLDETKELEPLPSVSFLREIIEDVLEDGVVTEEERCDVVAAILRVLPADDRAIAKRRVDRVMFSRRGPIDPPATDAQVQYLEALNVEVPLDCTKAQASQMLDEALNSASSVSNRQMMVLRFWHKTEIAKRGRQGVSAWMDEWHEQDERRQWAWDLWKEANGDVGRQDSPTRVPLGEGYKYLKEIEKTLKQADASKHTGLFAILVVACIVVFIVILAQAL